MDGYQRCRNSKSEVCLLSIVRPTEVALSTENMVGDETWDEIGKRNDALPTSWIPHTAGIGRWMSKANVSYAAFFEIAGLETELLPREYVTVCEAVDEVGRINMFVYAESGSGP